MYFICTKNNWNVVRWLSRIFLFSLSLFFLTSCASQKIIVNSLDEKEANEILVFLSSKGIDATKTKNLDSAGGGGGSKVVLWDINVSTDQANEAMAILNQNGLPRRRGQNLLGIFAGGGLVPSDLQEQIRYQAGLAETIASTIRKIDGVLEAEVQLSFPKQDPLNPNAEQKEQVTASVYVKHSGVLDDPNSHLQSKIKQLVAASVPGLSYDNVTIISDRARFSGPPVSGVQGSASEEPKLYTSVWTIIIAQESVKRFQFIFLFFVMLLLLLVSTLSWISWKIYPLLQQHGGIKELFYLHPITGLKTAEETTPKEINEQAAKKNDTSAEEKGLVDKDFDDN